MFLTFIYFGFAFASVCASLSRELWWFSVCILPTAIITAYPQLHTQTSMSNSHLILYIDAHNTISQKKLSVREKKETERKNQMLVLLKARKG